MLFLFLTPKAYPGLEKKFKKELKDGARVVIFSDSLNFWEPQQIVTFSDKSKLFFYIKGSEGTNRS